MLRKTSNFRLAPDLDCNPGCDTTGTSSTCTQVPVVRVVTGAPGSPYSRTVVDYGMYNRCSNRWVFRVGNLAVYVVLVLAGVLNQILHETMKRMEFNVLCIKRMEIDIVFACMSMHLVTKERK
jgi:hypothetical protein